MGKGLKGRNRAGLQPDGFDYLESFCPLKTVLSSLSAGAQKAEEAQTGKDLHKFSLPTRPGVSCLG